MPNRKWFKTAFFSHRRTTITSRYPPRVALSTDFVVFGYYKVRC